MCSHWHHHVQLEVAALRRLSDSGITTYDLRAHLYQRFRDDRIDLAGHNRASRLHLRQGELAETRAWAGAQPANVIRYLLKADRKGAEGAARFEDSIERALSLEVVISLLDGDAQLLRKQCTNARGELRMGVDAGANRRAPERDLAEFLLLVSQSPDPAFDLTRITQELLPEADRGCVLKVCAAGLDHIPELLRL